MSHYNLEPRAIMWNIRIGTWKFTEIIQQSCNGINTLKIQYANMRMDCCQKCWIIVGKVGF